ncbi:MDR family MFS transporter [Paenisporosarcina cavernae]|uniref:DHA2 family efflux MFS transporter permease subunit n=1 Tax=Paenisporosarcina cavernae TaxID=2320858 RepID=A0A385YTS8_9BACL|nr:MDR family MFS transporter [Paenisporosarcina cavernae]AYC28883.1 DHA2 family efflux MFS transporter permease subunit [Paenisporosarcina cavernae]
MEHLSHKEKMTIIVAIISAQFFAAVNQTIVGNALPKIIADLGGIDYYSWVFTSFMLTSAIMTVVAGKLSDIFGRKPFFLIGIGVFTVGAFLSGLSATIEQLIIFRAIQGIGAGLIIPTAFAAVGDLFSPRERGKWQGIMSSVFGISSVIGPTIGGYIVDNLEWKWVFWVFLPLGIVAFVLIWRLFPSVERRQNETIDYLGSIVLAATLVSLLLGLSWGGTEYAWDSGVILGLFAGAIIGVILFIFVENRAKSPILPLHLFKYSNFAFSNLIGFAVGIGMFGGIMYIPYFLQGVLGYSATHSSFISMTMTLGLVAASTFGGNLITKTGKYKRQATLGLFLTVIGLYLMSTMDAGTNQFVLVGYQLLVGFGIGIGLTVFTLVAQNSVSQDYLGVATAATQLFRSIGGTVGVAVLGTVLNTSMKNKLESYDTSAIPPEAAETLAKFQNPALLLDHTQLDAIESKLPAEMLPLFNEMIHHLQDALTYALSNVFMLSSVVMLVAALLTFFISEVPLRGKAPEAKTKAE